ncbi:MAG TPA: bifunctional oligoribonuclease/PAP phosphatase NrnA [Syntrophales bacterium]|nr:bifunctional oligoribonuclease/PAP phosphatase NrnA [Syntrophales bacterium]
MMFSDVIATIRSLSSFLITSHVRPDGDAVGSELALYHALRGIGKKAVVYNQDQTPEIYRFLPGSEDIIHSMEDINGFDAAFVLDCSDIDRIGNEAGRVRSLETIISIDHHISSGDTFSKLLLADPTASSTGEIVYRLLSRMGIAITTDIATNIYTAILTDTGSFRYSNTGIETFRVAADLVEKGADCRYIAQSIYETRSAVQVRLIGKAIDTLELSQGDKVGSICVTQEMLNREGALPEHTEGLVDIVRSIQGVEIAICYHEVSKGRYKISLRSKGTVNVEKIAGLLGGGGHVNASACRVEGTITTIKRRLIDAIKTVSMEDNLGI